MRSYCNIDLLLNKDENTNSSGHALWLTPILWLIRLCKKCMCHIQKNKKTYYTWISIFLQSHESHLLRMHMGFPIVATHNYKLVAEDSRTSGKVGSYFVHYCNKGSHCSLGKPSRWVPNPLINLKKNHQQLGRVLYRADWTAWHMHWHLKGNVRSAVKKKNHLKHMICYRLVLTLLFPPALFAV